MEIMRFDSVRKEYKDGDETIQALKSTSFSIDAGQLMRDLTKENNVSTVMVTHDTRRLKYCVRVFPVLDGVVMEKTDDTDSIN